MGEYENTLGPLVISAFVNTFFLGIIGFQLISYRTITFNDNWIIKALVGILFLVDVFQEIVAIFMVWVFCVSNYLNPPASSTVELWTYTVIPVCNAVSGLVVHLFLSHRIIRLAKRRSFYGLLVGSIAGISAVFALASSATSHFYMDKIQSHGTSRTLVIIWLATQALSDLMISASLSAHIYSKKSELGAKSDSGTHPRLSRTTGNIIQTGTLSTLFSACTFLLFVASPKTRIYLTFLLPLGRLYTNCLLGVLLGRDTGRLKSGSNSPYVTDDIWAVPSGMPERNQSFALVRVTTEREVALDSDIAIGYHTKAKSALAGDRDFDAHNRRFSSGSDVLNSIRVKNDSGLRGICLNSVEDLKATRTM